MECWEIRKTQPLRVGCIGSGQNPQPKVKFKPPDFRGFLIYCIFIIMKLIETLSQIIVESRVLDYFETLGYKFYVFETRHSTTSVGGNQLQRVELSNILDSMSDIKEIIAKNAIIVMDGCKEKECALLVRDNRLGFDYQMWIKQRNDKKIDLVINTSIHHPKKLFNQRRNKIIIVDYDGEQVMYESFKSVNVNNLIVQFGVL